MLRIVANQGSLYLLADLVEGEESTVDTQSIVVDAARKTRTRSSRFWSELKFAGASWQACGNCETLVEGWMKFPEVEDK